MSKTSRQVAAFKAAHTKKIASISKDVQSSKLTVREGAAHKASATRRLNTLLA